jgi:hypothetical protein
MSSDISEKKFEMGFLNNKTDKLTFDDMTNFIYSLLRRDVLQFLVFKH